MLQRLQLKLSYPPRSAPKNLARHASTFGNDAIPADLLPPTPGKTKTTVDERPPTRRSGYFYFDSVFPIHIFDPLYIITKVEQGSILSQLSTLVPRDTAFSAQVDAVLPRSKDGGAYVKFSYELPVMPYTKEPEGEELRREEERVLQTLEAETKESVKTGLGGRGWLGMWGTGTWGERKVFLVKGKPWLEDMYRFPSRTIKVEFEGPDIPQEELYEVFRPYGRIKNIVPPSPSSKDLPRTATITYLSLRSATSARNCLHNYPFPSSPTLIRILYAEREHPHWVWDWMTNHPRIVVPLVLALLGGVSWAVFDPVREWSVKRKVDGTWNARNWRVVKWLRRETLGRLGLEGFRAAHSDTGIEKERDEAKALLSGWLREVPDTFIVVTGPRGSGKRPLIEEVLASDSKNVLKIDCETLCKNARSDTKLVSELASSVGYWPHFVVAASINNLIDLASVGLIGQKAGFSASLDVQLEQILEVTASALKDLASETTARTSRAMHKADSLRLNADEREKVVTQMRNEGIRDGRIDTIAGNGIMSELGVGVERPDGLDQMVIVGPRSSAEVREFTSISEGEEVPSNAAVERLPVVVISGFQSKGEEETQKVLWDELAEWAAVLVENQVAHVIFTSDTITLSKPLAKALPSKPFNTLSLNDASPSASLQYVSSKLSEFDQTLPPSSETLIEKLGGRQTDLELLVQKIRAGLGVREAVQEIVERSAVELRMLMFGQEENGGGSAKNDDSDGGRKKWSKEQAWLIATALAKEPELKYASVLVNPPFKSNESALRALEAAEMISIHHHDGRPSLIRPGKPVYRSAFQHLLSDPVFSATISFDVNTSSKATALSELQEAEKALIELGKLFNGTGDDGKWVFGDTGGTKKPTTWASYLGRKGNAQQGRSEVPAEIRVRVEGLLKDMRIAQDKLDKIEVEKKRLLEVLARSE